jgi:uncharacterized protein YuzE
MKGLSIQVTYRKGRPLAAYIALGRAPGQKVTRTEPVTDDLLVDFDAHGDPLGIEVVTPEVVDVEQILGVFDRLGLPRPELAELAPLPAA